MITVLDGYTLNPGDLSWKALELLGEITIYDRTAKDEIVERVGNSSIVLTNKTRLTKEILKKLPNVKYIGVLATGYNVVDVDEAKSLGIVVTNVPSYGTGAVAQFVFAHLLEICHHVWSHSESVKAEKWSNSIDFCYWDYPLIELAGKTIGIIGMGRIGQKVASIAQAFDMHVMAYDININKSLESNTLQFVELDTLLKTSDVISLHCPLMESTIGIINKKSISLMKDKVIIINTSRGPLIVEKDLAEALNSGKVASAGVDVLSEEPAQTDNPLLTANNCQITPHIAWASKESRERLLNIAVENVRYFIEGTPVNVVS